MGDVVFSSFDSSWLLYALCSLVVWRVGIVLAVFCFWTLYNTTWTSVVVSFFLCAIVCMCVYCICILLYCILADSGETVLVVMRKSELGPMRGFLPVHLCPHPCLMC